MTSTQYQGASMTGGDVDLVHLLLENEVDVILEVSVWR